MIIDDDVCAGPCDEISGVGCPVEGVSDCCFVYPKDTGETIKYPVKFKIADNVGNTTERRWNVYVTLIEPNLKVEIELCELTKDAGGKWTIETCLPETFTIDGEGKSTGWIDVPISYVCFNKLLP
jgi:hypothetical protein